MARNTTIATRFAAVGASAALGAATLLAAPLAADASTGSAAVCHYTWGSLPESATGAGAGPMSNVRSGRHTCFDRLVIDLRGKPAGYTVSYVSTIIADGSGAPVAVRGGAKINISVNAAAYDANGKPTYTPANPNEAVNVSGYAALRQVRWVGSYEGHSQVGVGVRARTPFRVFTLVDGSSSRLVIDVAHNW